MILCLDSPSHYAKWELCSDKLVYYGAYKLFLGLVDLNKITCVVFALESSFLNHIVCKQMKKYGLPVYYLVDGVFEWNNSYNNPRIGRRPVLNTSNYDCAYLMSDVLTRKYLNRWGSVKNFYNTKVVGGGEVLAKTDAPSHKILLTTAKTPYFDSGEKHRLCALMNQVSKSLEMMNVDYSWRVFDFDLIDRIDLRGRLNNTDGSFASALDGHTAVITTPSSISVEAMARGLRVGHFLYRDCPITIPSAWNFHLSMHIEDCIAEIIRPKPTRRDHFQDSVLKEFTGDAVSVDTLISGISEGERAVRFRFIERLDVFWRYFYEAFFK